MTNAQQSELYWRGGPFRVWLRTHPNTSQDAVSKSIAVLEEFRSVCQKQYAAFSGVVNGRDLAYERFRGLMEPVKEAASFFIGTGFPESEQSPGRSTIAQMSQKEFLEALRKGGEFERQHAKAFVVLVYHLWDEYFRQRIARFMSVSKSQVECTLMGDIRHVRHLIIHKNSIVPQDFSTKLELLPQIWHLEPGDLKITEKMLHSLMEQLNAIRVEVNSDR